MGLRMFSGSRVNEAPAPAQDSRRRRFGEYFPRLFAYVQATLGDDARAREVVVEAFARVFARPDDLSDDEFPIVLFGLARDLCRRTTPARPEDYGLNAREREVISLLFDAQLSRSNVSCLLSVKEEAVSTALLRGLKKLRTGMLPPSPPSFLRLS